MDTSKPKPTTKQRPLIPLSSVLLIILIISSQIFAYPSKPLNERSTEELNWQAWLLVDQTNNRQQQQQHQGGTDVGLMRRKITPKSVFIAPTFSPESLPACAEGYQSDPMGRCVKMIRINEAAHLDFLLQKLNEQFIADYEDEEILEETAAGTPGQPLQFNIPLLGGPSSNSDPADFPDSNPDSNDKSTDFDSDNDMAIVVAPSPSKSNLNPKDEHQATIKLDSKRKSGDTKFNLENVAAFLGVKPEEMETTTITAEDFLSLTTLPVTTIFTTISPVLIKDEHGTSSNTENPGNTIGKAEDVTTMSHTEHHRDMTSLTTNSHTNKDSSNTESHQDGDMAFHITNRNHEITNNNMVYNQTTSSHTTADIIHNTEPQDSAISSNTEQNIVMTHGMNSSHTRNHHDDVVTDHTEYNKAINRHTKEDAIHSTEPQDRVISSNTEQDSGMTYGTTSSHTRNHHDGVTSHTETNDEGVSTVLESTTASVTSVTTIGENVEKDTELTTTLSETTVTVKTSDTSDLTTTSSGDALFFRVRN